MHTLTCIDCDSSFEAKGANARRCTACQTTRARERDNQRIKDLRRGVAVPPFDLDEALAKTQATITSLPRPRKEVLVIPKTDSSMGFGPQDQVAVFSDYQRGKVVDPRDTGGIGGYNTIIAQRRLAAWRDGVVRFRQTYRFPVKKLWVPALGDDIEGHGQIHPTQAYFLDQHLLDQAVGFVSDMEEVLRFFAAHYPEVEVVKVRGNHGRTGAKRNERPERDNIETILWMWLKDRLKDVKNLTINVPDGFFAVADILGHTFYLTHGEDIRPMSPYAASGGMNTKLRMNAVLGFVINYFVCAHHHYNIEFEKEIGGRFMVNGAFPGPDLLSVKWLHEANLPSQLIFAVHPKWGVTHRTNLTLARPEEVRDVRVIGR